MAALYLTLLVVLLGAIEVVIAANVAGAGSSCTYGTDTCTEAGYYCDSTSKCLKKAGQTACTADADCVTNAECTGTDTKTCTCKAIYVAQTTGTCVLKAGQTGCTANADCTLNSECSGSTTKTCTCTANYVQQTSGLCSGAMAVASSIFILIAALLVKTHLG